MRRIPSVLIGIFGVLLCACLLKAAAESEFKVIVNESNPTDSLDKDKISRLFLKKETKWEGGQQVLPVDQSEGSKVREAFTKEVHNKKVSAVNSYWQQMIFTGRAVPPPKKGSDEEVVEYVKSHPGAIGYVSSSASTEEVKVLKVKE